MAAEKRKLTPRQRRFVEEYVIDEVAVQAFFRAYGRFKANGVRRSYRAAQCESSRLLSNPIIAKELELAMADYRRRVRVSKARVVREIATVAFSDIGDAFRPCPSGGIDVPVPLSQMPPTVRRAIGSAKTKRRRIAGEGQELYEVEEVEYKMASKLDALDKLCRKLGIYTDDPDVKAGNAVIEVEANGRSDTPQ